MFGGQQNFQQNIQQLQFGQDIADNNQEQNNQDVEEVNPNAQWDLLAAQNVQNVPWDEWPAPRINNQHLLRTWKLI